MGNIKLNFCCPELEKEQSNIRIDFTEPKQPENGFFYKGKRIVNCPFCYKFVPISMSELLKLNWIKK